MKMFIILQLVSYRMKIVIFKVFAGKMCSAVSPRRIFMLILEEILY